jgi:hypothetical protein
MAAATNVLIDVSDVEPVDAAGRAALLRRKPRDVARMTS